MSNDKARPGQVAPSDSPVSFISCVIASGVLILLGFTLGPMFGATLIAALVGGVFLIRAGERWRNIGKGVTAAASAAFLFYFAWPVFYMGIPGAIISIFQIGQESSMIR